MKKRNVYLLVLITLIPIQLVVTALLLYVTLHTQSIHYFDGWGNPFKDNPIPLANILTVFEVIDLVIISIYFYCLRKGKINQQKFFVILPLAAFALGLAMLIYLHAGPLGSCMAVPDECGG